MGLMMVETQGAPPHKPTPMETDADTTSKLMVPAILLLVVVTLNLLAILYSDIEEPFFEDGSGAPIVDTPSETTPLTAASKSGGQAYDTGKADAAESGSVAEGEEGPLSPDEAAEARGPPYGPEGPPRWIALSVQLTCITYTFTRVFLRYSYESAMVVVYSQTYKFTDGVAGMVAWGSAFFALFAVFLWHRARNASAALGGSDSHTAHTIMVLSEVCGFACALVMIVTPALARTSAAIGGLALRC